MIKIFLLFCLLIPVSQAETLEKILEHANADIKQINTESLKVLLEDNKDVLLIDIRSQDEIDIMGGSIDVQQNINIPRSWLEFRIQANAPDLNTPIVLYCGTGTRSPLAAQTLSNLGYTNVKNYTDNFTGWQKAYLPVRLSDEAPLSMLYSKPIKIIKDVYSAIGETGPATYKNSGHNNNLSFIVSNEGVLVFNAGDNYLLAKALHEEIKQITDQPVKYVVLENAQGHATLGTSYWQEQGAMVIAQKGTVDKMEKNGQDVLESMQQNRRDKSAYTQFSLPDKIFDDKLVLELGDKYIEILHLGAGHSSDDTMLWMPREKLLISGDMAFHERLLPIFEDTDTKAWLTTWKKFVALRPKYLIPGHGAPTDIETVTKYTKDYLVYMRSEIEKILGEDGDIQDVYNIDQSDYAHLHTFKQLNRINATRMFRIMEFE